MHNIHGGSKYKSDVIVYMYIMLYNSDFRFKQRYIIHILNSDSFFFFWYVQIITLITPTSNMQSYKVLSVQFLVVNNYIGTISIFRYNNIMIFVIRH